MGPQKQRILAATLIVLVLMAVAAGGVYAYLSTTTGSVENTFTNASDHTISISEKFEEARLIKENVRVDVDDPGYAVYVRVAIIATWQKEIAEDEYVTHWKMPVQSETIDGDGDYYMVVTDNWFYKDGYYYLKAPHMGGLTDVIFQRCYQMAAPPDTDYKLHVEIIAQTIQALGTTDKVGADGKPIPAVTDAWGVEVNSDGTLKAP